MDSFKNKVAVVIGIGQGIALMFAREGAKVFGNNIHGKAVDATMQTEWVNGKF
jgi:NAD(P)-dependent dehydrogenase (short-subunit alcohol dehydrogenase family)